MADICRSTPEDKIRMAREARMKTRYCEIPTCRKPVHFANLVVLKDGRKVCPDCFDQIFEAALNGAQE